LGVFEKALISDFAIKVLQQALILLILLNAHINLSLKNYVTNGQQLGGAAKWADIVCEIDISSVLYHLLHNLIDKY
jgi:hypothetical protein